MVRGKESLQLIVIVYLFLLIETVPSSSSISVIPTSTSDISTTQSSTSTITQSTSTITHPTLISITSVSTSSTPTTTSEDEGFSKLKFYCVY